MAEPFRINITSVEWEGSDRRFLLTGGTAAGIDFAHNTTRYMGVAGSATVFAAEASVKADFNLDGKASDFTVYVKTNTLFSVSATITLRKNGVNTALAVSIPAGGGTGIFEDVTDEIALVPGDEIDFAVVVPFDEESPTAKITITHYGMTIQRTGQKVWSGCAVVTV